MKVWVLATLGVTAAASLPAREFEPTTAREQLHATLWMQRSPEYRAIASQTYRLATERLRELAEPGTADVEQEKEDAARVATLPTAIVLDLDETVLDNSAYQARQIRLGRDYDEDSWQAWMQEASATLIPGAREFLEAATKAGHRVFYVTNRMCRPNETQPGDPCPAKGATARNLAALGLPAANDSEALLLRRERPEWDNSDKGLRRAWIAERYRIVALIGDDLGDFVNRAQYARQRDVLEARFGSRWFALPNAMYGSWERAIADPACGPDTLVGQCAGRVLERKYASLVTAPPPDAQLLARFPGYSWSADRQRLRLATWNVEYVVEPTTYAGLAGSCVENGGRVPGSERQIPCGIVPRLNRTPDDLEALRRYAAKIDGDVVALQEVDGPAAASLLFPGYSFCFSTRPNVQKNGFAIRQGLPFRCEDEYRPISIDDRFRRGVVVTLFPDSADEMRLMNVHLKSGCPEGPLTDVRNPDCANLAAQVPALEEWIDTQARAGRRFGVLGDFNRRFSEESGPLWDGEGRRLNVWAELDDRDPAGSDLIATTEKQPFLKCRSDDPFDAFISHVVLGRDLAKRVVPKSWIRVTYALEDAKAYDLSDHCPVGIELRLDAPKQAPQ